MGRVPELRQLHNEWEAVKEGAQRLVLVSGDAGIGKSRLVAEFARQISVTDNPLVLYGRCDEDVAGPFEAIGQALAPYVRACNPARLAGELDDLAAGTGQRSSPARVSFYRGLPQMQCTRIHTLPVCGCSTPSLALSAWHRCLLRCFWYSMTPLGSRANTLVAQAPCAGGSARAYVE